MTTKLHDYEHEDGTTKMSKPEELQDDAPKSDLTTIRLCGIDYVESTTTLFEDDMATTTTTEPIKERALEVSDKMASKDAASILGGKSDDVPSLTFMHDDGHEMVEHGIFPSTMVAFGDELRDFSHHIESESDFTTSPICDEFHNSHVLGPLYDDVSIPGDFVLPLDKTMDMVEYDAPPTWFHHGDDDQDLVFATSPTG
ncbi:gag-pol polyprotein [Hordeum vulgare]|nr:gag-pol polyprotein [Hordeum vulgare]